MKPFRKHVAIAIDGGGIRGVIVTKALSMLEEQLGKPVHDVFRLTAGTSTGSIISAGIAAELTAAKMHQLYVSLGGTIFKKTLRSIFWPLSRYRFPHEPLADALYEHIGDRKMGDFWKTSPPTDVVITTFDVVANKTCFVKPWKREYKYWSSRPYLHPVPSRPIFQWLPDDTWMVGWARMPIRVTWQRTRHVSA
jgi:patatin-like phospholipase/acyl hydrolase